MVKAKPEARAERRALRRMGHCKGVAVACALVGATSCIAGPGIAAGQSGPSVLAVPSKWMSGAEIRAALAGKKLDGRYRSGLRFEETYQSNGRLVYSELHRKTGGRWSIVSDTLCTIYDVDPLGGCYRVHRVGGNCYAFYFVSRTEADAAAPKRKPSWTARGGVSGDPVTCDVDGTV